MGHKTALHSVHVDAGAKIVDFGGWDMPLHYGSQLEEHHQVRRDAGMFDVSHMTIVDISGADGQARAYLQHLLANDIDKANVPGKAVYTCMLNERGGVVDDLIAYWVAGDQYRLVVNAATRDKDLQWMRAQAADFEIALSERSQLAMIAVQGPNARDKAAAILPQAVRDAAAALKPFHAAIDGEWFVARTGYTGEDGYEIILPEGDAQATWAALAAAGVAPAGLGARDTLRLEAGLNLYGSDMTDDTTPFESNLAWTVANTNGRAFVGADALAQSDSDRKLVGLVLEGRGVLRDHQTVHAMDGDEVGEITSGGFSPTLQRSIALARVAGDIGAQAEVSVRNKRLPVRVVNPPFVRRGKIMISLEDPNED
ncbi:MAG: glycine cleavage system aminomethyltransferase GcvT [Pseudomonadota bacterium]